MQQIVNSCKILRSSEEGEKGGQQKKFRILHPHRHIYYHPLFRAVTWHKCRMLFCYSKTGYSARYIHM